MVSRGPAVADLPDERNRRISFRLNGLIGVDGDGVWATSGGGTRTEDEDNAMIAAFKPG